MFFIYIAYSNKVDKFYIGYSKNPWARIIQHQESKKEKFTATAEDWTLEAVFEVSEVEANAIYLERFIKKQKSRKLIEKLCDPNFKPTQKLAQLVRVQHMRD